MPQAAVCPCCCRIVTEPGTDSTQRGLPHCRVASAPIRCKNPVDTEMGFTMLVRLALRTQLQAQRAVFCAFAPCHAALCLQETRQGLMLSCINVLQPSASCYL